VLTLIAFLIVISVLILVHEFGHFLAAKSVDIQVPRFSLGLGPRVAGFTRGETEYVLSAIPLGGYVKMAGMEDDEAAEALEGGGDPVEVDPERTFDSKPLWARAWVISAGVIFNMIFAVLVFIALGLAYGEPTLAPPTLEIGQVLPGQPAAAAGLREGDRIVSAGGRAVGSWEEFVEVVKAHPGRPLALEVRRGGEPVALTVTPRVEGGEGKIGAGPVEVVTHRPLGAGEAVAYGFQRTWQTTELIVGVLGRLVTGQESLRSLGGPLTIGQVSGQAARLGLETFLGFMAIFSVNLAVFNLLPIPILDGGHLLFLGIEAVRGRALSLEYRIRLSQIGMLFVIALMIWALTNDVLRVIFKI
jgi:regulator of sigma E protease